MVLILRLLIRFLWFWEPIRGEVVPARVIALYEPDFLLMTPSLDFFLSRDGEVDVAEHLVMHEAGNFIAFGESGDESEAVLGHAALKAVCDAGIEVSRAAGEDVDVVSAAHAVILRAEGKG